MKREDGSYVGRLAPAPTGALHLGNARTFLIAWLRARKAGGRLLLRLEDLDHPKVKPGAAREAYEDLAWLGLDWDAGPAASFAPFGTAAGGGDDPYVQSNRLAYFRELLTRLRADGRIYPCVCTRKDMESLQSAPNAGEDMVERRYPGVCRGRFGNGEEAFAATGREPGWRFRVEDGRKTGFGDGFAGRQESVLSEWSGDFLIARGEKAGYQLAVVADDYALGVTEVVRGDDLLASTHRQLALYDALGYRAPAFYHVPLVVGEDGRRLAKRHGDTRLNALRRRGAGAERVLGWLGWSCGWFGEMREACMADIVAACDFSAMPKDRVIVTHEQMRWLGFETVGGPVFLVHS